MIVINKNLKLLLVGWRNKIVRMNSSHSSTEQLYVQCSMSPHCIGRSTYILNMNNMKFELHCHQPKYLNTVPLYCTSVSFLQTILQYYTSILFKVLYIYIIHSIIHLYYSKYYTSILFTVLYIYIIQNIIHLYHSQYYTFILFTVLS